jgi:hypothetical protein
LRQKFNRNDEERAQRRRETKGNSGTRRKIRREGKEGKLEQEEKDGNKHTKELP